MSQHSHYEEICQRKFQYCRALDERQWDLFEAMLTPELAIDLTELGGTSEFVSAPSYVNEARLSIGGFDVTQHVVSNVELQQRDADMNLTCYVHATHVFVDEDGSELKLVLGGSYIDRLIWVEDSWLFRSIKLRIAWSDGDMQLFRRARKRARGASD